MVLRRLHSDRRTTDTTYLASQLPSTARPEPHRFIRDWGTSRMVGVLHLTPDENYIIYRESTWNPKARNGQYFGLGQLSINARQTYLGANSNTTDPLLQLEAMRLYIRRRYGTEDKAVAFRKAHGWY